MGELRLQPPSDLCTGLFPTQLPLKDKLFKEAAPSLSHLETALAILVSGLQALTPNKVPTLNFGPVDLWGWGG